MGMARVVLTTMHRKEAIVFNSNQFYKHCLEVTFTLLNSTRLPLNIIVVLLFVELCRVSDILIVCTI